MAEAGRDLSAELFGTGSSPATTVDRWRQTLALDDLERQHDLPPGIMTGILRRESAGDPRAQNVRTGAAGIFQFMPDTARAYKIDPYNPAQAAPAAAQELRSLYRKYGGDVDKTLAAWNWGQGRVDKFGLGKMPEETRGFLASVKRFMSPASAEAATPQGGRDLTQEVGGGRDLTEELFGAPTPPPATAPATRPAPPTATSSPAQDAAPPPASATPPASRPQTPAALPVAAPGGSHGAAAPDASMERFLTLPSIRQLPPADRQQAQQEFAALRPDLQAEFLRSEEGSQPAAPAQPPGTVVATIQPTPTTMREAVQAIEPLSPRGAEAVHGRVHEQGIPLSAVPAIAVNTLGTVGGAALGAPLGPVGSAAGAALGGSLATRANTALGLAPQEKPLLETPVANVYPSDLLGAIPLGIATGTAALKGTVRNLPGANVARHEIAAERLGELGQRTAPPRPAADLFTEAAQQGGTVPTSNLWRTSAAVVREEQGMQAGFRNTESIQAGRGLLALMRQHGGKVPLEELEKYRQRLGQKIGTTTDQAELRRLREMYAALHGDLEHAATTGTAAGAGTLREAIAASRKEHAHTTLTDLWSEGKGLQKTSGDVTQVYGKRIRNQFEKQLKDDKVFAGSFTPEEVIDIRSTLRDVSKLTKITNPEAQGTVGSTLKWLGRLGGAGYGAASGDLLTGGMMILATEGASAVMANAMQSRMGRWALREAIREGNGKMTHGSLSAIAALLAREAAPEWPAPAQTP